MFTKSGESECPCMVLDFSGKILFFTISIMLAVVCHKLAFIMSRCFPSISTLVKVFIMNGCWILANAFSASIETIMWFLSFLLLMWCMTVSDLHVLNHPYDTGMGPTWS